MARKTASGRGTMPVGKPLALSELLAFQDGAIVSRTLVDKPVGTVTVFAFDRNEGLSEHTAPYDALVHVLEGSIEISISGKPNVVSAGQIILMPAGKPHALHATQPAKMLLIMVRA